MLPGRIALMLLLVPIAISLLAAYVVRRASWAAGLSARGRRIALAVVIGIIVVPWALRLAGLVARDVAGGTVAELGFGVGLTVIIAAAMMLPFDALRGLGRMLARLRPAPAAATAVPATTSIPEVPAADPPADPPPAPLSRREFVERAFVGAALTAGVGTSGYGIVLGRHDYVVEQVPIPLRGLPRTLDGYTIVQLSDLHVGTFVGEHELAAAIDLARRARPDLIVLTGDLLDHDPRYAEQLGRFARRLGGLGARDGVVAIPGNHDYYAGVDQVLGALRRADVRVLRNDGVSIGDGGGTFALLGVDDVWAERGGYGARLDLDAALRAAGEHGERDRARVLLCHNPEAFPDTSAHVDLQLSGHTHGGQVNVLVRPADLVLSHGYIAGHYVRDRSQIYVNRGFGTAGPPARVGSPPEISRIVLTSA